MGSKHLGADVNLAWPTAQIAVMGAPGRGQHPVPQGARATPRTRRPTRSAELIAEYEDTLANPYIAAERGYVDAVIPPSQTRGVGHQGAAACCATKRRDPAAEEAREHPALMATDETGQQAQEPQRPLLRVVRGEPTPEELAALVAVLTARRAPPGSARPTTRSSGAAARLLAGPRWHQRDVAVLLGRQRLAAWCAARAAPGSTCDPGRATAG